MDSLFEVSPNELTNYSLPDYFRYFESRLSRNIDLDSLTAFLSDQPFTEYKPYLTRRKLNPFDNRFNEIEIVYHDNRKVGAIVWELPISLTQLTECFGQFIVHNFYYDRSTEFAFLSKNKELEVIKTRHPEYLTALSDSKSFEYENEQKDKIVFSDPQFNFVQFTLKD
jgi:hypothetical protein